jgi:predicted dehydrogenase
VHARRLIESGTLGEINHFRGHFLNSYAAHPQGALSWRFVREYAGLGALGDLMSHAVDLAQFLLGPIESVSAQAETFIRERPKQPMGSGTHFSVVEGGETAEVENEDAVWSLIRFAGGAPGVMEASRVVVGADCRLGFEANGTAGAVRWEFERMNELDVHLPLANGDFGYSRVLMGPDHPPFQRFQPGRGVPMGYDDLKVIEAYLFCQSVADGEQREPGVREMLAAARVIDAMERSSRTLAWEDVGEITRPA